MPPPGLPSSVFRWICHIPAGYVARTASRNYYTLVDLSDEFLDEVDAGHALVLGIHLTTIVGWTIFVWNFVQFAASFMIRGALLWLTGFVDLTFAILLTVGCANVASFLPHSIAGCRHAADWRNTADGRNLFKEVLDTINDHAGEGEKAGSARSTCKDMVTLWIVADVVVVVYYILGIMNMCLGSRTADTHGTQRSLDFHGFDLTRDISRKIFIPVTALAENTWGVGIFVSRLTLRIYRRVPTLCRENFAPYFSRIWNRRRPAVGPQGYHLVPNESREPPGRLPLEVVYMISELVHYTDLVSLSQSSWALRTAFFGDSDPQGQRDALQKFTCDGEKWSCVVCHSQICSGCNVDNLGNSEHARHLGGCQPHCTSCYWRLRCGSRRRKTALLHPGHERGCYVLRGIGAPSIVMGIGYSPTTRKTCGRCSAVPLYRRRRATEPRDEDTARHTWRGDMECKVCCVRLGGRPLRWWVCSCCGGDCLDGMHPLVGSGKQ